MAGRFDVAHQDLGWCLPRRDPVVELRRRLSHPTRPARSQLHASHSRVVPKEAVAPAGQQERDGDLGVALDQVNDAALLIELAVLMLAQAVEPLAVVRRKTRFEVEEIASSGGEGARWGPDEMAWRFAQELGRRTRGEECQLAVGREPRFDATIADNGLRLADLDDRLARAGLEQRAGQIMADGRGHGGAHAQAVASPRLDPQRLVVTRPDEGIALPIEHVHVLLLVRTKDE